MTLIILSHHRVHGVPLSHFYFSSADYTGCFHQPERLNFIVAGGFQASGIDDSLPFMQSERLNCPHSQGSAFQAGGCREVVFISTGLKTRGYSWFSLSGCAICGESSHPHGRLKNSVLICVICGEPSPPHGRLKNSVRLRVLCGEPSHPQGRLKNSVRLRILCGE